MSQFQRSLPPALLDAGGLALHPWLGELLALWRVAGAAPVLDDATGKPVHLRFFARPKSANFYRDGQSVADVRTGRNKEPYARVHRAYVDGPGKGQIYHKVDRHGVHRKEGSRSDFASGDVLRWCLAANGHSGEEKKFVEKVLAANSDVIDVEMGLAGAQRLGAPRIDLVSLEPSTAGWRVVMWEVKRAGDGRARSRGEDTDPELVDGQLTRYDDWLKERADEVAKAARETCRLLTAMHAVAEGAGAEPGELGAGIRAVAASDRLPEVDTGVRVLIDATDESEKGRRRYKSFQENGHLEKLRRQGRIVQVVRPSEAAVLEVRA